MNEERDSDSAEDRKVEDSKGKWGYIVCFGTIITFIAGIGHVNSFGLIYNDFIIETRSSAKSLTTAHGVFAIMLAIGGIILNIISKVVSLRLGGLLGSVTFTLGSFATVFISNTNQLPLTFGILQGLGFGMMVPVCYATLNHYFIQKRTTVMSICKAIQGVILVWYPQILRKTMSLYGLRGTLVILSAISLNTIAGMSAMRIGNTKLKTAMTLHEGNEDLLLEKGEIQTTKPFSIGRTPHKKRFGILKFLNLKVLKDPVYCNICIGQAFVNFSDLTFFMLQPMLLFQHGYDKRQVALCISVCAGADVAGRCALALVSSVAPINTRLLYYVATLFTLVIRIVLLQVNQFPWVVIVTGVLGFLRSWLHITSPLVVSNHVSREDFPGAYAMLMLVSGAVNVTFGPIIGLLKDLYEDYVPAFYALSLCCVPCLLFWPFEYNLKNK